MRSTTVAASYVDGGCHQSVTDIEVDAGKPLEIDAPVSTIRRPSERLNLRPRADLCRRPPLVVEMGRAGLEPASDGL
jgi:hypothetical protein